MKKILLSLIVALFIMATSMPVESNETLTTGNDLVRYCEKENRIERKYYSGYCDGVIRGFIDGVNFGMRAICLPENITHSQLRKIIMKYLEDRPEILHQWYGLLIANAFTKVFPCEETEPFSK